MKNSIAKKSLDILVSYGGYIAFVVMVLVFFINKPTIFFTPNNILNIIVQSSVLGIVSCGMTVILIGGGTHVIKGGIDLSLANNLALGATVTALLIQKGFSFFAAFGISFLISLLIGVINAIAVVKLKVAPLLVTLSMMYVLNGISISISNNSVVSVTHPILQGIANGRFLGMPIIVWFFIVIFIVLYIAMNKTSFGNRAYATGGNKAAAIAAGINADKIVMLTYIIAAATASISGLLSDARLTGSVPGMGDTMFLDVMLIAYMSAIFSKKAVPNITGALISSLFVGMISNGFTLMNVPSYWIYAIKGVLILISVSLTSFRARRSN
ncbi:MAG: ABC transporter permease [Oscillospiraceae bacterium]